MNPISFHIILLLLISNISFAQEKFTNCTYRKFTNGKISVKECMDEKGMRGKTIAYNMKGEVIGEWSISRMHMLSSVYFTFHANGGVYKAHYSSHPDAGIQWYKSTTEFNDKGEQISFMEHSHDDHLKIFAPKPSYPNPPKPDSIEYTLNPQVKKTETTKVEKEIMKCAVIYASELWLDNRTSQNLVVAWHSVSDTTYKANVTLPKGQRTKVCERILAEQYEAPLQYFTLKITTASGKNIPVKIQPQPLIDESRIKEHKKGYVYEVVVFVKK